VDELGSKVNGLDSKVNRLDSKVNGLVNGLNSKVNGLDNDIILKMDDIILKSDDINLKLDDLYWSMKTIPAKTAGLTLAGLVIGVSFLGYLDWNVHIVVLEPNEKFDAEVFAKKKNNT
jgi:hypothetical protein